jgi:amidase
VRAEPQREPKPVNAICDDVLGTADAVEIARRIAEGEIQPLEAVEAAIARTERVNGALNAIATPTFDAAREETRRRGQGLLAGVPSLIKDNEAVEGTPLLHGSRGMPQTPVAESSPFVEQFLSLGLISIGKTTMPEFGLTGTTEPLLHGPTHNPWRPGFSPGGSSGGSAALVAAGAVPIAHANDGGGSTRIPASCCGLVGLKPTRGRLVDMEGAGLFPVRIVHQGVLSRTVRDTAAFYHGAEQHYRNHRLPAIGLVTRPGRRRLRVGFFTALDEATPSHPDCVSAVRAAAALLESNGHSVAQVSAPFDDQFHEDFFLYWSTLSYAVCRFGKRVVHPDFDRSQVEPFTEGLTRYFQEHRREVPAAIWRLRRFRRRYARAFESCDVLMNPSVAMPPPEHGYIGPDVPFETALERLKWFIPFTPTQNVSGGPAISLPLGRSEDGLPLGVQLAAPFGDDRTLLELAFELEAAAPWPLFAS